MDAWWIKVSRKGFCCSACCPCHCHCLTRVSAKALVVLRQGLTCPVQWLLSGFSGTGNTGPIGSRAQIVHKHLLSSLCCLFFSPSVHFFSILIFCHLCVRHKWQKENSLLLSPPCSGGSFSATRPCSSLGSSKELSRQNSSKHQWLVRNIVLSSWAYGLTKIKPLSGWNASLSLMCAWC